MQNCNTQHNFTQQLATAQANTKGNKGRRNVSTMFQTVFTCNLRYITEFSLFVRVWIWNFQRVIDQNEGPTKVIQRCLHLAMVYSKCRAKVQFMISALTFNISAQHMSTFRLSSTTSQLRSYFAQHSS